MVKIYSVRDQFTGYGQPFTAASDAVAIRDFRIACNKADSLLYASPKDFDLMCLGTFDSELGVICPEAPVIVASGVSCVQVGDKDA